MRALPAPVISSERAPLLPGARRVLTAVLQSGQRVVQLLVDLLSANDANDTTHVLTYSFKRFPGTLRSPSISAIESLA